VVLAQGMGTGLAAVIPALLPEGDVTVVHTALRTASIAEGGPYAMQFHPQRRDERVFFLIDNGSCLTSTGFFKMAKCMEQVSLNAARRESERFCYLLS